jgi:glycosyltransferase involved in cell wall biosynthesis
LRNRAAREESGHGHGQANVTRVGIGLPVRNGERFLQQTLDALLAQSFTDFELVVADNGSTDGTEEICRSAAARDERVRYERSGENRGAGWNFNRAFALTRGEYFKWSAYDDLCEPAFLERCLAALDADPGAVLAYPRTRFIDENGAFVRDHDDNLELRDPTPHARLARVVAGLGYANPVYGVMRSDALRRTRLMGSYASTDYVLLAELAMLGAFVEVPERLFLRRLHPEMSRAVNPDAASVAAWYRPGAGSRFSAEAWRLCYEHVRAIGHVPLSPWERLRCAATFCRVGGRRYWDHLARELRDVALALVRPAPRRLVTSAGRGEPTPQPSAAPPAPRGEATAASRTEPRRRSTP